MSISDFEALAFSTFVIVELLNDLGVAIVSATIVDLRFSKLVVCVSLMKIGFNVKQPERSQDVITNTRNTRLIVTSRKLALILIHDAKSLAKVLSWLHVKQLIVHENH